jgi:hypothetical protein
MLRKQLSRKFENIIASPHSPPKFGFEDFDDEANVTQSLDIDKAFVVTSKQLISSMIVGNLERKFLQA